MSAALSTFPILPRLRAGGADAVIRDGRPVLRNASRVPPALMAEASARRDDLIAELTAGIITPCARCGTPSTSFIAIINPDLWQCDTCLPADPNDHSYEAIERVAIMTEAAPTAPMPHHVPVSWSDMTMTPLPGARCRNCDGATWWCEAVKPKGWRCSICHPGDHLPVDRRRDVRT